MANCEIDSNDSSLLNLRRRVRIDGGLGCSLRPLIQRLEVKNITRKRRKAIDAAYGSDTSGTKPISPLQEAYSEEKIVTVPIPGESDLVESRLSLNLPPNSNAKRPAARASTCVGVSRESKRNGKSCFPGATASRLSRDTTPPIDENDSIYGSTYTPVTQCMTVCGNNSEELQPLSSTSDKDRLHDISQDDDIDDINSASQSTCVETNEKKRGRDTGAIQSPRKRRRKNSKTCQRQNVASTDGRDYSVDSQRDDASSVEVLAYASDSKKSEDCNLPKRPKLKRQDAIVIWGNRERQIAPRGGTPEVSEGGGRGDEEVDYAVTEEEYPAPSTSLQKEMRRLARQRQLERMRAREAAEERQERMLRRQGLGGGEGGGRGDKRGEGTSGRSVQWSEDLVTIHILTPSVELETPMDCT